MTAIFQKVFSGNSIRRIAFVVVTALIFVLGTVGVVVPSKQASAEPASTPLAKSSVERQKTTPVGDGICTSKSGVNGTSRWSLGTDCTLTIGQGTFTSGYHYHDDADAAYAKKIEITGKVIAAADSTRLFSSFDFVTEIDGMENLDTSQVTNMTSMFAEDPSLTSLDVSNLDTGRVTNMSSMFDNDSALTPLDVSKFDTGQVTNMGSMFYETSALTSLDVSKWDTGQVTNMDSIFYEDPSLTSLDVSKWDTGRVTNMLGAFSSDTGLTSLDVSKFDTSRVTNMSNMFVNDTGLRQVKFGPGFKFVGGTAAAFPDAGTHVNGVTTTYTGKWVNVGEGGSPDEPMGPHVWNAGELMTSYDGSNDSDTYVWQPISQGVKVSYVDENGRSIHDDQMITGGMGDTYDATKPQYKLDIPGYVLDTVKLPTNATGTLTANTLTVTYVYKVSLKAFEISGVVRSADAVGFPSSQVDVKYAFDSLKASGSTASDQISLRGLNAPATTGGVHMPKIASDDKASSIIVTTGLPKFKINNQSVSSALTVKSMSCKGSYTDTSGKSQDYVVKAVAQPDASVVPQPSDQQGGDQSTVSYKVPTYFNPPASAPANSDGLTVQCTFSYGIEGYQSTLPKAGSFPWIPVLGSLLFVVAGGLTLVLMYERQRESGHDGD